MIWYLLNIIGIIIAWGWPVALRSDCVDSAGFTNADRVRSKRTCIIGAVNWVLLSGLRAESVGADTEAYAISFWNANRTSWETLWNRFSAKYFHGVDVGYKDVGFSMLEKAVRSVTSSYTVWLLLIAIIFTVPMAIYIYRFSKNACVSWIVYSTLFYSFFAITGHRQTIATAIVLWGGIAFIRKRKLVPFLALVLIACTIHASAICVLPFYWLSRIKITRAKLAGYMMAIIGAFLFRNQLLAFLQSVVGYGAYQEHEGAKAGVFMFLLLAMAFFTVTFWRNIAYSDNQILDMSVNAFMMACILSPLLLINPSCMRVVQYYSIFMMFLIPEYALAFDSKSKKLFLTIICGLMIVLLIRQMPTYRFFFA